MDTKGEQALAKVRHGLHVAPATFEAAFSWIEMADWIPSILAGLTKSADLSWVMKDLIEIKYAQRA